MSISSMAFNEAGVLASNISDPEMIFVSKQIMTNKSKKREFRGRDYKNYERDTMQQKLNSVNWNRYYEEIDANRLWEFMTEQINIILDEMCPYRNYRVREIKEVWVTPEVLERIKTKDELWKIAKRSGDIGLIRRARKLRNDTTKFIKKVIENYIRDLMEENKADHKKFWREINWC